MKKTYKYFIRKEEDGQPFLFRYFTKTSEAVCIGKIVRCDVTKDWLIATDCLGERHSFKFKKKVADLIIN